MDEVVFSNTTFARDFDLTENVTYCLINGTLNVRNVGNETISDIFLRFNNTWKMSTNFTWVSTSKFGNQTKGQPGTFMIIHIPSLRPGNVSTFIYQVDCMHTPLPLNITTTYTNYDHNYNRKVLAGYNWTVNQSIRNENYLGRTMSNINITMTAQQVVWNNTFWNFSLHHLHGVGDYANVVGNGTSTVTWYWTPSAGDLVFNESENISFIMGAPLAVPFTATYRALIERVEYQVDYLLSDIEIEDINGTSDINVSFEKRISQPADNTLSHNVTWEIRPKINTRQNITYDVRQVTLWVTENLDPLNNTANTHWGRLEINYTGDPLQEINISSPWDSPAFFWYFNYTDGANSSYPPPVVWIEPEWMIAHRYGQILNYTSTVTDDEYYMKYIYVVQGYWLEVAKNVTNIGEDMYQVSIHVENIGNGWTPEFERVTVYDFVPYTFGVWDMQPLAFRCPTGSYCQNLSVGSEGAQFYGMSYRWDIPWKGTMNSSLGPKVGPYATGGANYSWNVSYKVNGTGPYRVTDLYIVGLDPLKVDGAGVSPVISVITGLQSHTREIIYVGIVAFLIIINVSNLIITNKIHKRLEQK
jgi:hypothetical protein